MTEEQQKQMLLLAVRSMVIELDDRLGDDNPWKFIDFDAWNVRDLSAVKRTLHELLYVPPKRS